MSTTTLPTGPLVLDEAAAVAALQALIAQRAADEDRARPTQTHQAPQPRPTTHGLPLVYRRDPEAWPPRVVRCLGDTVSELLAPWPTTDAPPPRPSPTHAPTVDLSQPVIRRMVAPKRPRKAVPPPDSAPSGEELARRRAARGLSQRDLADASGLSRGIVAETERGRRNHVLTRQRLADTLARFPVKEGAA